MNLLYLLPLIPLTNGLISNKDWIDPHDMNAKVKHKFEQPSLKRSQSAPLTDHSDPSLDIISSHLKRVVSILMSSAHVDKRDPNQYHGHVRFSLEPDQYEFLAKIDQVELNLDNLRKIDRIMSDSFRRTFIDGYMDAIESFQLKLYSLIINKQNVWLLGAIFLLYVVYQLFKSNFSFAYIFKYLIMILLIVDLGFRYHTLVEEAEQHNLKVVYSGECDVNEMSWGKWMSFMMSTKECGKKSVTPLDAFLYQIKHLIIIPLDAFGTGMGGFGKNMFTNLPLGLNLIMWPLMLIFLLVIFLFLITICTGNCIEFNIFHLVKLKFGGGKDNNAITAKSLEGLMDKVLHRPMVQNVNISVPTEKVDKIDVAVMDQDKNPLNEEKPQETKIPPPPEDEHVQSPDSSTKESVSIPTSPNEFLDNLDAILNHDFSSGDSSFLDNSIRKRRRETIGSVLEKNDPESILG